MEYILSPSGDLICGGELYHYGVKGMKWGIRRYQSTNGSPTVKRSARKSSRGESVASKGKRYVKKIDGKKVTAIVSSTAAVASGVLWAASAFSANPAGLVFARGSLSAISAAMSLSDAIGSQQPTARIGRLHTSAQKNKR